MLTSQLAGPLLRTACGAGVRSSSGTGDLSLVWRLNFFVRRLRDLFSASLGAPPSRRTPPPRPRDYQACAERGARRFCQAGPWVRAGVGCQRLVVLRNAPLDRVSKLASLSVSLAFARPWNLGWSRVHFPEALSHPGDGRDRCSVSAERFLFLDPSSYRHLDS